jgi:hypothetical protein
MMFRSTKGFRDTYRPAIELHRQEGEAGGMGELTAGIRHKVRVSPYGVHSGNRVRKWTRRAFYFLTPYVNEASYP